MANLSKNFEMFSAATGNSIKRSPIGFRRNNEPTEQTVNECSAMALPENRFLNALVKSFQEFVVEEMENKSYTFERLKKKYEAALTLFEDDRKELPDIYAKLKKGGVL